MMASKAAPRSTPARLHSISASPAATRWMKASMLVTTLVTAACSRPPRWSTFAAHRFQGRPMPLERRDRPPTSTVISPAAAVHAAGDRAGEGVDAGPSGPCVPASRGSARRSCSFRSRSRRPASRASRCRQHGVGGLRRGQAGDQGVASRGRFGRALRKARAARHSDDAAARSRSWTATSKPPRTRLAARWRPRWPRPMKA